MYIQYTHMIELNMPWYTLKMKRVCQSHCVIMAIIRSHRTTHFPLIWKRMQLSHILGKNDYAMVQRHVIKCLLNSNYTLRFDCCIWYTMYQSSVRGNSMHHKLVHLHFVVLFVRYFVFFLSLCQRNWNEQLWTFAHNV